MNNREQLIKMYNDGFFDGYNKAKGVETDQNNSVMYSDPYGDGYDEGYKNAKSDINHELGELKIKLADMSNNNYENTYDIEFCVSVPLFFRVQAYTVQAAMNIAYDHLQSTEKFIFRPSDTNTGDGNTSVDIVMIRKREDICDLGASNEDMIREYNYIKAKAK